MAYRTTSWKNTDIGKIPSDWDLNLFKNTFTKYPTNSFTRDEMNDFGGSFQNIHYGDILTKYGAILDFNKYTVPYLNSFISKTYKTVQNGDIIIADTAEDETVGKCVEIYDLPQNIKVLSGMHTMFCRPTNYFYPRFLGYYMNSRVYHNQLLPYITGTKVSAVSKTDIDKTYILAPSIPEQQKIADVLTDVDDLIAELERVRNKKIAIKTGVMQELLSGKRRLPGFNKPWKEVELGEIGIFDTCSGKSQYQDTFGKYLIVDMGAVSSDGKLIACKYSNYAHDFLKTGELVMPKDDIGGGLIIGKTAVIPENNRYIMGDHVFKITVLDTENPYFISAMINSDIVSKNIHKLVTGSAQLGLAKSNIKRVTIKVPTDKLEQTAIADILADMDDEISAISDKINKYKQIKSGVAGELLSGRIRLVKPQE